MFYLISEHGDPGHTFGILFDEQHVGWDGDGCDVIEEINFIDKWKKKKFYEYYDELPNKTLNPCKIWDIVWHEALRLPNDHPFSKKENQVKLFNEVLKNKSRFDYQRFLKIKEKEIGTKK